MRSFWIAALAGCVLACPPLVAEDYDQDDDWNESRSSRRYRDADDEYSQYGHSASRTSRDYDTDDNNDFDDNDDDRYPPSNSSTRDRARHQAPAFDNDDRDERDDYSSQSYQPQTNRTGGGRIQHSVGHDYHQGFWSRSAHRTQSKDRFRDDDDERDDDYGETDDSDDDVARNRRDASHSWLGWWTGTLESHPKFKDHDLDADDLRSAVRSFVRQHDEDDDGYLTRSELPREMRDHFFALDTDSDDYLSRSELAQHGQRMDEAIHKRLADDSGRAQLVPVDVTYIWVRDASQGHVDLDDLQDAYQLLQRIDQNGDGRLTRGELRKIYDAVASGQQNRDDSDYHDGRSYLSEDRDADERR